MAPSTEKRHLRWPTKTKRGFAGTVPDWTIAEDDDDKYDVHIMKRRSARHKVRRDTAKTSAQESELYVSMFEEYPTATATATATQPYSTVSSTPTAIKYESESGSGSDSSDDESGSDDENEESDDEKESDPEPTGKTESVSDQDLEVKLPATATDSPSVQAPSAEGSTDGSMVSSMASSWIKRHMASALKARAC